MLLTTNSIRVKDNWKIPKKVKLAKSSQCEPLFIDECLVGLKFTRDGKDHYVYLASNGDPESIKEIRLNVDRLVIEID